MSDAHQPWAANGIASQAVELLITESWLYEPHPELASTCRAVASVWSPTSLALLAAAVQAYLEVERAYELAARDSAPAITV